MKAVPNTVQVSDFERTHASEGSYTYDFGCAWITASCHCHDTCQIEVILYRCGRDASQATLNGDLLGSEKRRMCGCTPIIVLAWDVLGHNMITSYKTHYHDS